MAWDVGKRMRTGERQGKLMIKGVGVGVGMETRGIVKVHR